MANTTFSSGELVTAAKLNTVNPSIISTGGSVARTLAARAADIINVLDYGVSTTETASNNTTAFANAIQTGKTIFIPSGTYDLNYLDLSGITDCKIMGQFHQTILNFGTGINNLDGDSCAVMINSGTGGTAGTHGTSARRLRIEGLYIDANELDIGVYADYMTDSHLENIAIRDVVRGLKINYSWVNVFTNWDIQEFTHSGVYLTGNNVNANTLMNFRVSANTGASRCYHVGGNSTKLISCDAEGSVTDFTGMDVHYGRAISIDGCHFENGRGILYSSDGRVESLSITETFFDCGEYAISNSDYAESLTITGNIFKSAADSVALNTLNGVFAANKFEGGATYSIGANFKGILSDGDLLMQERRLSRRYIRLTSFAQAADPPSTLATFTQGSGKSAGKILLQQRITGSNVSSAEIQFAIAEDNTLQVSSATAAGSALGIVLSVVDDGSTLTLKGYGTYAAPVAGYVDIVTY